MEAELGQESFRTAVANWWSVRLATAALDHDANPTLKGKGGGSRFGLGDPQSKLPARGVPGRAGMVSPVLLLWSVTAGGCLERMCLQLKGRWSPRVPVALTAVPAAEGLILS